MKGQEPKDLSVGLIVEKRISVKENRDVADPKCYILLSPLPSFLTRRLIILPETTDYQSLLLQSVYEFRL